MRGHGAPGRVGASEAALQPQAVGGDQRGCRVEDASGRAIAELEVDTACFGEVLVEAEDVLQLGAPPAVDGLVGVADGEHVVASFGELAQQDVLRQVRVLVLVDQDVREPFRPAFADIGHVVQQPDGGQEQIVEVEGVAGAQRALVHAGEVALELCILAVAVVARVGHRVHRVLQDAYLVQQRLGPSDTGIDALFEHAVAQQRDAVGAVDDAVVGGDTDHLPVLAQDGAAQAMESRDPDGASVRGTEQGVDAFFHLAGRLAGEGQGGDRAGGDATVAYQMCDARTDDTRLPRTGPGDDEQRAVRCGHGFELAVVEAVEQGGRGGEDGRWCGSRHDWRVWGARDRAGG